MNRLENQQFRPRNQTGAVIIAAAAAAAVAPTEGRLLRRTVSRFKM